MFDLFTKHFLKFKKGYMRTIFISIGVVGLTLLLSSIIIFHVIEPDQSASLVQNFSSSLNWAGPTTFGFVGGKSSAVTVVSGSTVQGTIAIKIFQAAPLRFFIDDSVLNSSKSSLPTGISISLNIYGNSCDPLFITNPDSMLLSNTPLVSTTIGETTVQYTINLANTVPKGTYDIKIVCQSFLNNGNLTVQSDEYEVTLHV